MTVRRATDADLPVLDVLTTRSGKWTLLDAGADARLARYLWTLDANPRFVRVTNWTSGAPWTRGGVSS